MTKFEKYRENLRYDEATKRVFSYDTHVATVDGQYLIYFQYWSVTTSKHINYVAKQFGLVVRHADEIR